MPVSIFDEIRSACAHVADSAQHVRLERSRISEYAEALPIEDALFPSIDPVHHYLADPGSTAAFFLTLDTVNFGSGYFPHLRKRPGLSGYFTIATSLKERFEAHGPFTASELSRLTAADCRSIFGQVSDRGPLDELMALFAHALNDLGGFLSGRFEGRFTGPVEAAGNSAERLVKLLVEMRFFRDVARYENRAVPFYKRAQLTAADLALAMGHEGLGRFDDLDRLAIFADNLVPHVLCRDGILHYSDTLASCINREEIIPAGSREEVELRACAVHAVELIGKELRREGKPVTSMALDYLLWNRGQGPEYRAHPRHRTRTVYY
jgi:Potential Queuosine, Q, salvage protein family